MSNSFGNIYRTTTFGESHGSFMGAVIDGLPGNLKLDLERIQTFLDRRKPGQSSIATPRKEQDKLQIVSGLDNGFTLGSPLTFLIANEDKKPQDYDHLTNTYRPSHSDWSWEQKFGIKPTSGGGRLSARETIGRVLSGAVAEQVLEAFGLKVEIIAWVDTVGSLQSSIFGIPKRSDIEANPVRCPDPDAAQAMEKLILKIMSEGDSIGGTIKCCISGLPIGLGEPVFSKTEAELARAMMSLPASKSFEIGEGLKASTMLGSEHNDLFQFTNGKVTPATNRHGGTQGGITTSLPINFRVGFKPVSTLGQPIETMTKDGKKIILLPKGRHDPCVLPRAVPIVEAMAYMVILDLYLTHRARTIR